MHRILIMTQVKKKGEKCRIYNEMIEYYNLKVAILQMIRETPKGFEEFRDIMLKYYVNNYEKYRKFLEKRMHLPYQSVVSKDDLYLGYVTVGNSACVVSILTGKCVTTVPLQGSSRAVLLKNGDMFVGMRGAVQCVGRY